MRRAIALKGSFLEATDSEKPGSKLVRLVVGLPPKMLVCLLKAYQKEFPSPENRVPGCTKTHATRFSAPDAGLAAPGEATPRAAVILLKRRLPHFQL